jgi:hypothetical protein
MQVEQLVLMLLVSTIMMFQVNFDNDNKNISYQKPLLD